MGQVNSSDVMYCAMMCILRFSVSCKLFLAFNQFNTPTSKITSGIWNKDMYRKHYTPVRVLF
jgi:hypothetical protein